MDRCHRRSIRPLAFALASLSLSLPAGSLAQAPGPPPASPCGVRSPATQCPVRTFRLRNTSGQNDANEIMVALRNMVDPTVKIYLVNSSDTVVMAAPVDQLDLAQQLIAELDRPHKTYRLTFTLADLDGNRTVDVRHASMILTAGHTATLKQGDRVAVMPKAYDVNGTAVKAEPEPVDVGLNLEATVTEAGNGLSLKSKVEESTPPPASAGPSAGGAEIHQAMLEAVSAVPLGKTVTLGTIDLPDSTHHLQVEVVAEPVS